MGLASPEDVFPWQSDLFTRFINDEIPAGVDVPTGLGKTAVMAIWLAARACGAKLPRRLVYVVDRRAVVDQATDVAVKLRDLVDRHSALKKALHLGAEQSLPISTLRGQYVDNRTWLEDPAATAIIVGTVDMIGSRLLFEGYGVSRKMRPYHAGLLGADSLVILDEAHLVPPFEHLLRCLATDSSLRACDEKCRQCVPPFRVLALSATGRRRSDDVVKLTDKDLVHPVLQKRLNAQKALRLEPLGRDTKLEDALAKEAWKLSADGEAPVRILVYLDSRDVARRAKEAVEKLAKGGKKQGKSEVKIETELFVGGRRVFEREGAKERLNSLGFLAASTVERSGPVFLFATSAAEVGVDLDADHMVCDLVAWERMVQRLGRVNRRGEPESHVANIVVITQSEPKNIEELLAKGTDQLSDKERKSVEHVTRMRAVQCALKKLPGNCNGTFDASPGALHNLKTPAGTDATLQKILDDATTPEPLRPGLTRPLVDAWAMTSLEKHTGRPAIQPWLRGWIKDDPPQTAVVWRMHLPLRTGGPPPRKKEIEDFFEAAPPHMSEILETETFRVVEWLAACTARVREREAEHDSTPDEPHLRDENVVAFVLDPDGGLRKVFRLAELDPKDKKGKEELRKLLAGATLIVDARLGGLKDGLLDNNEPGLPRTADDGQEWIAEGVVGFRVRNIEASAEIPRERNWLERLRFASAVTEDGETTRWLIVEKWREDAANEEDRSGGPPQLLDEHQSWTEERARWLAGALDLDGALAEMLALAARLHDEGKQAARWQRAFRAPKDGAYAKTEGPIDYRLLDGYRHELGSLLRLENDARIQRLPEEHRDLILHLIAAHHGFARPVIGTRACQAGPPSALEAEAAKIALRFARLQDRWGPWGLAWCEALLRAADQQASRCNERRGDVRAAAEGGA